MRPHSLKTRIVTPLMAETRDFYRRHLGLVVAEAWDDPGDCGCILAFPDGRNEAYLEIHRGDAIHGFAGISLQFRTADLDGFVAGLDGDLPRRGPEDRPWGSRYLFLTDPNGIDVVIFEGAL
jgi:catechol 2,3-dioxygenase-like lactoylglutathione lyase family enzyme